jgi:hypothetical protein
MAVPLRSIASVSLWGSTSQNWRREAITAQWTSWSSRLLLERTEVRTAFAPTGVPTSPLMRWQRAPEPAIVARAIYAPASSAR